MNYDGKVRVHIFDEKNGLKRNSLLMNHMFFEMIDVTPLTRDVD